MMPGRGPHRGVARGGGRLSGRGDGRGRTNGRHGTGDVANAPAKQTVGFQATLDTRFTFVALCLMGKTVQVATKDGSLYEGIFHTWHSTGKELSVVLRYAYTLKGPKGVDMPRAKPAHTKIIYSRDLCSLDAKDVKLGAEDVAPIEALDASFLADSEISGNRGMQHRELQRFAFDMADNVPGVTDGGGLEDSIIPRNGAGWRAEDMFNVNSAKFGTVSTFDENLYTTRLDRDKAGISEAEATRLAAAILAQKTTDSHVNEERGLELDDGRTEEERYGSVVRAPGGAAPPPPAAVPAAADPRRTSMPAVIPNARKEVNEVRNHLLAGKGSFSKSPLQEYTILDNMRRFEALGLNPGTGNKGVNAKYATQFHEWKSERASDERRAAAAQGAPPPAAPVAVAPPAPPPTAVDAAPPAAAPPAAAPPAPAAAPTADAAKLAAMPPADAPPASTPQPEPKKTASSFKFNVNATEFSFTPKTPAPAAADASAAHNSDAASSRAESNSAASSMREGSMRREHGGARREKSGSLGAGGGGFGPRSGMRPALSPQMHGGQHPQQQPHHAHQQHFHSQQVGSHMNHNNHVMPQYAPVMTSLGQAHMQMPMQAVMSQPIRAMTPTITGFNPVHTVVPVRTVGVPGGGMMDPNHLLAVQQAHAGHVVQPAQFPGAQFAGMPHQGSVGMVLQPRPAGVYAGAPVFVPSHPHFHRGPE